MNPTSSIRSGRVFRKPSKVERVSDLGEKRRMVPRVDVDRQPETDNHELSRRNHGERLAFVPQREECVGWNPRRGRSLASQLRWQLEPPVRAVASIRRLQGRALAEGDPSLRQNPQTVAHPVLEI